MTEKTFTTKQRAALRGLASRLTPLVQIGKIGFTQTVADEIAVALFHHELIKVSVLKNCQEEAKTVADRAARACQAQVVTVIGGKIVLYKRSDKEGIEHLVF